MKTSKQGIELIKSWEGLKLKSYQDSIGKWTIGYGTTNSIKEGLVITEYIAEILLEKDLERFENYVNEFGEFEQHQFDALVSLAYNVGSFGDGLKNAIHYEKCNVPTWIKKYNKAGGKVLSGLVRRRESESILFCTGEYRYNK